MPPLPRHPPAAARAFLPKLRRRPRRGGRGRALRRASAVPAAARRPPPYPPLPGGYAPRRRLRASSASRVWRAAAGRRQSLGAPEPDRVPDRADRDDEAGPHASRPSSSATMPVTGGLGSPMLYAVIIAYVGLVAATIYNVVFRSVLLSSLTQMGQGSELARLAPFLEGTTSLLVNLLFGPVFIVIAPLRLRGALPPHAARSSAGARVDSRPPSASPLSARPLRSSASSPAVEGSSASSTRWSSSSSVSPRRTGSPRGTGGGGRARPLPGRLLLLRGGGLAGRDRPGRCARRDEVKR